MKNLIFVLILVISSIQAKSQSISIFDIDTTNFPTMKAKFYAFDKDGKPTTPNISDLQLTENGINRTITSVSCPNIPPYTLSVGIMVDTYGRIDLARKGVQKLIDYLYLPQDEIGITYMAKGVYIYQDFTKNKPKASVSAANIPSAPGVDINAMFYSQYTGGITFIKDRQSDKKILILVSDLHCPNLNINEAQLIADAKANNISIYSVLLGSSDYTGLFTRIAKGTGGIVFQYVNNENQITNVFQEIENIERYDPCEILWESNVTCDPNLTYLELKWQNEKYSTIYVPKSNSVAKLNVSKVYIALGKRLPNTQNDTTITLTAENTDFAITGIKRKFGSNDFSFVNTNFPILIPKNMSKDITLRYSPSDSSIKNASFEIETDKCSAYLSTFGGFFLKNITNTSLKLTHPNGGEVFTVGSDTIITWEGVSPTDTVTLEYSIDNGINWNFITNKATNLKYYWSSIPYHRSKNCLVKVSQGSNTNEGRESIFTFKGHISPLRGIAFSPDGNQIATASLDETAKIWDISKGIELKTLKGHTNGIYNIVYSPDGKRIATASTDKSAKIWDVVTGNELISFNGHNNSVIGVAFSPDGSKVATGSGDNTAIIWDSNSGSIIKTFNGHAKSLFSLAFSPEGSRLATASSDKSAIIWDSNTGSLIKTLNGHTFPLRDIAFSPDGTLTATAGEDWTIKIWDSKSGKLYKTLLGHKGIVSGIVFSPDGKLIASSSYDNTSKIWNIPTGFEILTLSGHYGSVMNIDFSPNGNYIATAGYDSTAKIWDIEMPIFQEDISDSVFSMVAPTVNFYKLNIDMGKVVLGQNKDTIITDVLCNIGEAALHVMGVDATYGNISDFMVPRGAGEFYLQPNECRPLMFDFMPTQLGIRNAKITVKSTIGDFVDTINITGEGIAPQLEIVNNLIDFGSVLVGEFKDSTQVVTIKNVGTAALNINNSLHLGPNDIDFTTLSGAAPFSLNAGESATMNLRFTPKESGRTSGRLQFEFNGAGSPATVQLFGTGIEKYSQIESIKSNLFIDSLICGKAASKDTVQISNSGTDTLKIVSLTLEGNNPNEFKVDNLPNNNILSNKKMNIIVNYMPTQTGLHKARLKIESNSKVDSVFYIDLEGRKDSVEIKADKQVINFGKVLVNKSKDTTLYIQNNGTLNNTIFTSLNNSIFASDKNKLNITTIGNDSLKVSFKGSAIENTFNGNLTLTDSICKTTKIIQLIAEVYSVPQVQINIGSDSAYTNEEFEIPVSILANNKLLSSGVTAISFELEMNKTILFPIGVNSIIEGENRIIKFDSVPIKNVGVNEIAKLKFIATLGTAEETTIRVRNIFPIGNDANFDVIDGNFKLLGVCKEGGDRFLSSSLNQTKLLSIAPNPATESIEIEYSNADEGEAEIIISNYLGQAILTQKLEKTQTGKTKLDLSQLPTGQYVILFKTETVLENKVIQVIK